MMKRLVVGFIIGFVLATGLSAAAQEQVIRLIVNGQEVQSDVPPQIIDGRVMVPARPLAEALGAAVTWDPVQMAVIVESVQPTSRAEEAQPPSQPSEPPSGSTEPQPKLAPPPSEPVYPPDSPADEQPPEPLFIKVNGKQTREPAWIGENGELLVSMNLLMNDILAPFYGKRISLHITGIVLLDYREVGRLELVWVDRMATYTMESVKALGLIDYTWNPETMELEVWAPNQGR